MKGKLFFIILTLAIIGTVFISGCVEEKPRTIDECEKTLDKDACYQRIAIETEDTILCKKITSSASRDGCYYFIAIKTKDKSLCKKVTNNIQETTCYAIVANDSDICEKINDSFGKKICYTNFAERTKKEEITPPSEEGLELIKESGLVNCEKVIKNLRLEGILK